MLIQEGTGVGNSLAPVTRKSEYSLREIIDSTLRALAYEAHREHGKHKHDNPIMAAHWDMLRDFLQGKAESDWLPGCLPHSLTDHADDVKLTA